MSAWVVVLPTRVLYGQADQAAAPAQTLWGCVAHRSIVSERRLHHL